MDAERPTSSPERGQRPQSQMDAERPTASPEEVNLKAKWMLRDLLLH